MFIIVQQFRRPRCRNDEWRVIPSRRVCFECLCSSIGYKYAARSARFSLSHSPETDPPKNGLESRRSNPRDGRSFHMIAIPFCISTFSFRLSTNHFAMIWQRWRQITNKDCSPNSSTWLLWKHGWPARHKILWTILWCRLSFVSQTLTLNSPHNVAPWPICTLIMHRRR